MRTTSMLKPTFWTRGSGKKLRGKPVAQVLAAYLMTSPHGTMLGIYYESLVSILHNTGLTDAQFRQAMDEEGVQEIAQYDEEEGLVYLPGGSEHQIGETCSVADKKRSSLLSQLKSYGKHRFVKLWIARYYDAYNLSHNGIARPFASPIDAPSMGHATPLHAPDPDHTRPDPDLIRERVAPAAPAPPPPAPDRGDEPPPVASLQDRAQAWLKDPMRASLSYPDPHRWGEALELAALVATTFGHERPDDLKPPSSNGSLDSRVRVLIDRWAEGTDQARMRQAIRGARGNELIAGKPELQSLATIFKDGNSVDKYCRIAKSKDPTPASKSNVVRLTPEAAEARRKFRESKDI